MRTLLVAPGGLPEPPISRACPRLARADHARLETMCADDATRRELLDRADVVAIHVLPDHLGACLSVAREASTRGCITVLIVTPPIVDPVHLAMASGVDLVVRARHEHALAELLDHLDGNPRHLLLEDIDGITFADQTGAVVHGRPRFTLPVPLSLATEPHSSPSRVGAGSCHG